MDTEEAVATIWAPQFERTYRVWGKEIVLRALNGPEVSAVNKIVAHADPEDKAQALGILTVASSLVSVDGVPFGEGQSLNQRAAVVAEWLDPLVAAIGRRFAELERDLTDDIDGLRDPNSSAPPGGITAP